MKILPIIVLSAMLAACATDARVRDVTDPSASRALEADSPVHVAWTDPAQFREIRFSGNRWEARRGDWVRKLAEHLQTGAERQLPEGHQLQITLTDIDRAGDYEPWYGPQFDRVRIMRDIHWPKIDLSFVQTDADGRVVAEGERTLSDPSYLRRLSSVRQHHELYYEKALLDSWLRREFNPGLASR